MDLSPDEDHFPGRLLHQAALWDNVELLQELLSMGADVDALDACGRSALHAAALAERSRCLRALLAAGAKLDAQAHTSAGGKTALHIAAERGHVENVMALAGGGAALDVVDARGDTALALAERGCHRHAARALRTARDALERSRLSQHAALRELVSRGESCALRGELRALGAGAALLVNMTPGGANTLLYVASETGATDATAALLEAGADGRAHPVTRYCPLYIACYHGHHDCATLLLHHFPSAVRQETVEKWLPLHAACIGGHASLVTLLLQYPYPESVLSLYTDVSGQWQYSAAFDVNACDVSGQSALYVACTLGNLAVVEALLSHTVPATPLLDARTDRAGTGAPAPAPEPAPAPVVSPRRGGISLGIHAIVSKLTGAGAPSTHAHNNTESASSAHWVRPVRADCARGLDSCVACAVRGGHARLVRRLLAAGAPPDASAAPPHADPMSTESRERRRSRSVSAARTRASASPSPSPVPAPGGWGSGADREGGWTALALAARAKNVQIVEMLLSHGATDPQCRALRECARHGLTELVAALLATKAYPDPDYKLNKSSVSESVFSAREGDSALTYSALCPTTPVIINWRELRAQLAHIRMSWVRAAALRVNGKLSSAAAAGALHAITRLDLSYNELRLLPPELFTLLSLRYLNVGQNKLERLPSFSDPFEEEVDSKGRRVKRGSRKTRPDAYSAPVLQELYLQDNRLEELPPELFSLPALTTLDVSNNKLRALPPHMWCAPALRDLNAALNHLKDLPAGIESPGAAPPAPGSPSQLLSPSESSPQLSAAPAPAPAHAATSDHFTFQTQSSPGAAPPAPGSPSQLLSPSESSPQLSAAPAPAHAATSDHFTCQTQSKSSSRSPSIESDTTEDEDGVPALGERAGNAVWSEACRAHTWRGVVEPCAPPPASGACPLTALSLAHNQFTCVPAVLACRAPALTRLNMAYNSLRSMSYVTSYPTSLRQLDLSHNEVTCWPSLPQVESFGSSEGDPLACYCVAPPPGASAGAGGCVGAGAGGSRARPRSGGSVRSQLLSAACPARRHLRLEGLRTLILANNLLTRIQLTTDDDGCASAAHDGSAPNEDDDWEYGSNVKGRLLFPLLSMLDVSCNMLRSVPPAIHELTNLAVLNISGNKDITDLPPQMGLLSRLWNLNTVGCSMTEPLRSMLLCGRYKSMDIVGYLKSVLQEARPYTRMKLMFVGLQGIGKTSLLECLRQESAIQHRRKPTDHWAKRMGNKSSRRGNVSTVGVDIGTWAYEKQRSTRGPVTFRTWDFGGQQEYYATHQYFLSRRSLYLVVWRATDGRRGLAGALTWLRSIQARAPGSPVIMVATHYDQVAHSNLSESESPEALQRLIRSSIMGAPDADKLGLPRVLDSVEVSCSTRHNIRLLADIIYSIAFSVKPPGSKEPLLEQRIPATYLALEECASALANQLPEPVLRHDHYKRLVTQYMQQKGLRPFRDAAELHQATMFLHDNGVLLHYDDATLKELYFLRPQWLCDVLAHVVTVREINPFATNGIMKVEDLVHVFKASPMLSRGEEASSLGVSLLNKFELALCWDARVLLVPPLLSAREPHAPQLPIRSRSWSGSARGTPRRAWPSGLSPFPDSARGTDSPTLIQECGAELSVCGRSGGPALRRLLLLSYVPCGFWPRLCTRVLADAALALAAPKLYRAPGELEVDEAISKVLDLNWGWKLWKTGLKLVCGELTLLALRELPARRDALLGSSADDDEEEELYHNLRLRVKQEGAWCELDVQASACVEILLPAQVCVVRREDGQSISGYQSISLEPSPETLAKVLALISDHVDLLLEDWYPSLGTRFVHTSEGRCLITRVVPCPACLRDASAAPGEPGHHQPPVDHPLSQALRRLEVCAGAGAGVGGAEPRRARLSEESRASDGDSGVGAESNASSRLGSVEGVAGASGQPLQEACASAYGWTVEECILAACSAARLQCARHADIQLRDVAPDTLLLDVEEQKRARWEHISRTAIAGRGAFGTVLCAVWRQGGGAGAGVSVALKALQPVAPPTHHDVTAQQAYKAALSRWERDPTAAACRAYCGLRQELSILSQLRHPHVVPLIAVCGAPLALLLALAPQGALDVVLRGYRGCGSRVGARAARALALQVARALEYLHARRIVYRDLKSENVLVWAMPKPQEAAAAELSAALIDVHVKLGDYGISRLAPPSGTKGFGGTEGFMAPEIMRYNGEEEYNEKVDCFSFGMLVYEIVTLRQPFEGHEAVKEAVLDGARPTLSPRELQYPCCMLETMRRCWSGAPELRPSAAALVSVSAAPEFTALQDACACAARIPPPRAAAPTPVRAITEEGTNGWEIWYGGEPDRVHTIMATPTAFTHQHTLRIPPDKSEGVLVTTMCRVGNKMWLGDSAGRISVYQVSTCSLAWSVHVQEAVGGAPSAVSALLLLPRLQRVALALACGRLFLVTSQRPEAEASFVLTELGTASELCCLAAVSTPQGVEVWAGGDGLHAYAVGAGGVCGAHALPAAPRVALLAAPDREPYVFAYTDPGVCVYQWCVRTRLQTARLDCSKLVPCSESLQSISIDEHLNDHSSKVTALCALRGVLYVGTAWGCIIVADASSLRPLTVFRPYEEDVRAILPLTGWGARGSEGGAEGGAMLATLGNGYRPLLHRYAPAQSTASAPATYGGFYCLLWRAQHWLPD